MTHSPAWQDINPAAQPRTRDEIAFMRDRALRVRRAGEFAAQLVGEGQLDRAIKYLSEAIELIEELK